MKKVVSIFFTCLLICLPAHAEPQLQPALESLPEDAPGLRVGDVAPDFKVPTYEGGKVKLSKLYKEGPVVLIFYRGAWCPYCNLQLRQYQHSLKEIESLGASVLAVSVDKVEYTEKTRADQSLGFDIVSDPTAKILEDYQVTFQVPTETAELYRDQYGIDLEVHSGRTDHVIAVPATYVIDKSGVIVFAYADLDYKRRAGPDQVIEVLEKQLIEA